VNSMKDGHDLHNYVWRATCHRRRFDHQATPVPVCPEND
jgi:hypothetical protein